MVEMEKHRHRWRRKAGNLGVQQAPDLSNVSNNRGSLVGEIIGTEDPEYKYGVSDFSSQEPLTRRW